MTGTPLLGGEATYTVTVTNSGDVKGYDLDVTTVFSSSREGSPTASTVTVVSARDADGAVYPTSVSTDPATGDTTVTVLNIRDLAPTESYILTIVLDLGGDPSWAVGDQLTGASTAAVNDMPDASGTWYQGSASASGEVVPIKLVTKSVAQSTAGEQATGTLAWPYSYTLDVQNNYVADTDEVVVVDTLPDGVEFLGVTGGPALDTGYPQRDAATGETILQWTLGTMTPTEATSITYSAGIRYDYYGTGNGGTNRPHDDFSGTPPLGTPIPDDTAFENTADLTAVFQGEPVTDHDVASVTGSYLTISKSGTPSSGGNGTVVAYTLRYYASEYYDILQDAGASPPSITVVDTLPDGMTYNDDASPAPSSWAHDPLSGTTTITWGPDVLAALSHGTSAAITFSATVDDTWEGDPYTGQWIVGGDFMSNTCTITGIWDDLPDPTRPDGQAGSASGAGFSTGTPGIEKEIQLPDSSSWVSQGAATVGDVIRVRVRFNTNDGATPIRSDIRFGRIAVTDWLPPGCSYNGDAVEVHSGVGDFTQPADPSFPTINPAGPPVTATIGSLQGVEWYLGDVAKGGWWEAEFTMTVTDASAVADGVQVNNLWKLTGVNTFGQQYSDRDATAISYVEPHLVLDKTASPTTNLEPGDTVTYTVTIDNSGGGAAHDVRWVDTVADGMRDTTPTVISVSLDGSPLAEGTDYKLSPSYDPGTGAWGIDFHDTAAPAVDTPIPAGSRLTITYGGTIDDTAVARATLTNVASVGYNTQADGSGRETPPTTDPADDNTDDAAVQLAPLAISKSVSPTGAVTIGDTLTYTLRVTVPAGMIAYWPMLRDTINRDGFSYVAASTALSDISGTPSSGASFDPAYGSDPVVGGTASNSTFTWYFNDPIDNGAQATDYVFELSFQVLVDGLEDDGGWEFWLPTATDSARDNARIYWNTTDPATRPVTPGQNVASNNIDTPIVQPLLRLSKDAVSSGPYVGGSTITYESVISHDATRSRSTAYDVFWKDQLSALEESPALVSVVFNKGQPDERTLVEGTDFSKDFSGDPVEIDFNGGSSHTSLPVGDTITITYTAQVVPSPGASAAITDTADVDWASKDGSPAGSRVYDDSGPASSWTEDTASETVYVRSAAIQKSVSPVTATIGQTVTYTVRVTVPSQTELLTPTITDAIATSGLVYVPGSAAVADVSGDPVQAATLSPTPPPNPVETRLPGSSTIVFTFVSPIDNAGTGGQGDTDYVFDLTYDVLVTGTDPSDTWLWDPTSPPHDSSDVATLDWNDGSSDRTASDDAELDIVQPWLELDKEFDAETLTQAQPVSSTVVIRNKGESTSYPVPVAAGFDFVDTAPNGFLSPTGISVVFNEGEPDEDTLVSGTDYSTDISGNDLRLRYLSAKTWLDPADTLTIRYTNDLDPAVATPGRSFTNDAVSIYASLPSGGDLRVYGQDPDPFTDDRAQDSDTVTIVSAAVVKTDDTTGGTATIGETFNFLVDLTIPQGTRVYRGTVADVVPDGLTVLGATTTHGSVVYAEQPDGTTDVDWTLPDPFVQASTPPLIVPRLTIQVRVDDTFTGGSPVSGLPPQSTFTNTAELTWYGEPAGGDPLTADDDDAVTAVEPRLTIDKQVSPTSAAAGDTVRYTVTLDNTGTSAAHDIVWADAVPAQLFDPPGSPTLVSVTHSAMGPLGTPASYTADFSMDPTVISLIEADHPLPVSLTPTQTLTIVYDATVPGGIAAGLSLTNTAAIEYDSLAGSDNARHYGPTEDSATVTTLAPELTVAKRVTAGQNVSHGGTVSFEVTVTNTGDATAYQVDVADTLPGAAFTYVNGTTAASWPGGSSTADPSGAPGPDLSWALDATLDPGQSITLAFDMLVGIDAALGTHTNTATAAGQDGGGGEVTGNEDDADFNVVRPGDSQITVAKSLHTGQADPVRHGDPVVFDIVITNSGAASIVSLPLQDTFDPTYLTYDSALPAPDSVGSGTLEWTDLLAGEAPLAPTESITVEVTFTAVLPEGETGATTTNTALVSGAVDEYEEVVPPSDGERDIGIIPPVTDPSVSVAKDLASGQADPAIVGRTVDFRIVVTNTGDVPLETIPLTDTYDQTYLQFDSASPDPDSSAAGTLEWTDLTGAGQLAVGDSITITVRFTALVATAATTDTALVSGATDPWLQPAPDADDDADVGIRDPEAHVTITKSLAPGQADTVVIGDQVTFDIVVANAGDNPLVTLPLSDTYDSTCLRFVSATPAPDAQGAGSLTWHDLTGSGDLPVGESITIRLTFVSTAVTAAAVNTATVAGAVDEEQIVAPTVDDDAQVAIDPLPASFSISKSKVAGQKDPILIGEQASFRIVVTNTGRATLARVPLTDVFDASLLTFVSADPAPDQSADGRLDWTDITGSGDLAPGESVSVTVTFRGKARSAAAGDTASVSGAVTDDGRTLPAQSAQASVSIIPKGRLTLKKTVRDVNGGAVLPGDVLLWTITVKNVGAVDVTELVIKDTVPAQTTYVRGSITGRGADDRRAPRLRWAVGTVRTGKSVTVTFRSRVKPDLRPGTRIRNTATVDGLEVDPYTSQTTGDGVSGAGTALARTSGGGYGSLWLAGGLALLGSIMIGAWRHGRRRALRPEGGAS